MAYFRTPSHVTSKFMLLAKSLLLDSDLLHGGVELPLLVQATWGTPCRSIAGFGSPASSPLGYSLFVLLPQSSLSTLRSSGSCFSVACGSLLPLAPARCGCGRPLAAVTTSLPALGPVFSGWAARTCSYRVAGAVATLTRTSARPEPPGTQA